MRNLFIIISFTMMQYAKKKLFILTNLFLALIIIIVFALLSSEFAGLENLKLSDEDVINEIVIIDKDNIWGDNLKNLDSKYYNFTIDTYDNLSIVKEKISTSKIYGAVIVENGETKGDILLTYICINSYFINENELKLISELFNSLQTKELLIENNIPVSTSDINISYEIEQLSEFNYLSKTSIISLAISFILFFAIYLYGHSIASSISNEKMSKVIETLVTSAKPSQIVLGKTIAMGLLGLLQLLYLIVITFISYKVFIPQNEIIDLILESININTSSMLLVVIYFVLGYLLYAFLNAIAGSTISRPEEVQIANMPVSFISMISFYLAVFTLDLSGTGIHDFVSFFPFSSVFSMPAKVLTGSAESVDIYVSLIILMFTIILLAFISIRIYSSVILHTGNRIKLKDLFNIFIDIK